MNAATMIERIALDAQFQAACQRYAHGNGSSHAIAAAAARAISAHDLLLALIAAEAALNHIRCTSRSVPWDDTGPAVEQARVAIARATA